MTTTAKGTVLIVDDDRDLRDALSQTLDIAGYRTINAAAFIAAKDHISRGFEGVVITDMMMPGRDGFHLLDFAREVDAELPVILLTGQGSVPAAVKAISRGAFAFLEKPCASVELLAAVDKAIIARGAVMLSRSQKQQSERGDAASRLLFGVSALTEALRDQVRTVARANVEVVVTGEPGAGIAKIAEVIHLLSAAASQPFIKRAGAALTVEALEDAIAAAGPGTFYIDEAGKLPTASQYHLLGLLDAGVAARVIAGSTENLAAVAEAGDFYADLFHRLDLMRVRIPALRERPDDIPVMFRHYVAQACEQANLPLPDITPEVTGRLMAQDWSGNARALMNAAMRFAMGLQDVEVAGSLGLTAQMAQIERSLIIEAMQRCAGKASETAKLLQLPRKTFYDKLAKHGLRPEDFR